MDAETLPLLDPKDLERSEILLWLDGTHGKRRMAPIEGGAATTDEELNRAIRDWARRLRLRAQNSALPPAHSQPD